MVPAMVRTAPDPTPYLLGRLKRGFAQLGMRRQPKVIVRRKVDDPLAIERALGRLFVFEHAQLEVGALWLSVLELVGEIRERIDASRSRHEVNLATSAVGFMNH